MKKYLFISFFLLANLMALAQITIKGRVIDPTGAAVEASNVLFYRIKGGKLLGFATSNKLGEFSKTFENLDTNVIYFKAHHMSFEAYEEVITDFKQEKVIVMKGKNHLLDEIIVRNKKVERRGDTLTFDFDQYKDVNDKNIEDVLKKLPNVTVSESGQIRYKDLPISKFYINNLDMLEGRYGIATRNLDLNAVKDVQIFENHQNIRVLQPISSPENAALNLQLKSKITFSTSIKTGVGYKPTRYAGAINSFGFQGRQQFNINAFGNNNGLNMRSDAFNQYAGMSIQQISDGQSDLMVTRPFVPLIDQRYYLENRELGGGINYLRKFTRYIEFKFQSLGHIDKIRASGNNELNFITGTQRVFFNQELKNFKNLTDAEHKIVIEWNAKKIYLRLDSNVKLHNQGILADNLINSINVNEDLKQLLIESQNVIDFIFAINKKAIQIRTEVKVNSSKDTFDIFPSQFNGPSGIMNFYQTRQNFARQNSEIHSFTSFFGKKDNITYSFSPGAIFNRNGLQSQLNGKNTISEAFQAQGARFENDVTINKIEAYTKSSFKFESNKLRFSTALPFKYQYLSGKDEGILFNGLIFKPEISLNLDYSTKRFYGLNYKYSNDLYSNNIPYDGLILSSYQNLNANPLVFRRLMQHSTGLSYIYVDIMTNMQAGLGLQLSHATTNVITDQNIDATGVSRTVSEGKNIRENLSLSGKLKKTIFWSKVLFDGNLGYSVGKGNFIINKQNLQSINQVLNLNTNFSSIVKKSFLTLDYQLNYSINNLIAPINLHKPSFEYAYVFSARSKIKMITSYQILSQKEKRVENTLLDLIYTHKISKHKIEIELIAQNLTNQKYFTYFRQGLYDELVSNFLLRPRQVFVMVKKQF